MEISPLSCCGAPGKLLKSPEYNLFFFGSGGGGNIPIESDDFRPCLDIFGFDESSGCSHFSVSGGSIPGGPGILLTSPEYNLLSETCVFLGGGGRTLLYELPRLGG